jgi:hypothetical protein
MKSIIRPFLFAAARLGLFFAVTAWIAGQWRMFKITIPFQIGGMTVLCHVDDWAILHWTGDTKWGFLVSHPRIGVDWHKEYFNHGIHIVIRHYLVVTSFVLFYGLLKWVYRNRSI